jgi:AI-2 transport protein TqsA
MVATVLVVGKNLIIPFIVALLVWLFINTVANGIKRIPVLGEALPLGICILFSLIVWGLLGWGIVSIVSDNVTSVINALPRYQDKLLQLINKFEVFIHLDKLSLDHNWMQQLNLQSILLDISSVFTTLASNAVIIVLYVLFLFIEQKIFPGKIDAFFRNEHHRHVTMNILHYIVKDTQVYIGIKTVTSLLTASLSWVIMWKMGLDFSEFWALLIFFLNFIPSIGAIMATAFPAILALIQFPEWPPFLVIALGLSSVQFMVGNFLEPRLMGYSLNLSPLVIWIALGVWGSLWGVIGMFLSVPITVTMMIILSHFEKTRGIAILLSRDGHLKKRK